MPMRRSRRELLARIPKSSEPSYLKVPVYLADETTARFETRSATTPEQALCAAVLSQALIDLRTNVQIEYVRDWVAARYPAAITFVTCCDALGLDPAAAARAARPHPPAVGSRPTLRRPRPATRHPARSSANYLLAP